MRAREVREVNLLMSSREQAIYGAYQQSPIHLGGLNDLGQVAFDIADKLVPGYQGPLVLSSHNPNAGFALVPAGIRKKVAKELLSYDLTAKVV